MKKNKISFTKNIFAYRVELFKHVFCFLITFHFSLFTLNSFSQGIAINTNGNAANNSAVLDISSTNQGILIPRLSLQSTTDNTTITSGDTISLVVYNSNASMTGGVGGGFYWWDGTVWRPVISPAGAGTTGQVLTSGGTLQTPTWTTPTTYSAGTGLSLSSNTLNSVWTKSDNDIYNNNTGNVGIGTMSPASKLEISGTGVQMRLTDIANQNPILNFYEGTTRAATIESYLGDLWIGTRQSKDILFITNSVENMRITNGGRVGIGTSAPSNALHIVSNANTANVYVEAFGDGGIAIKPPSDLGGHLFYTSNAAGNAYRFVVDNAGNINTATGTLSINGTGDSYFIGNVGIGTTTPNQKLEVANSDISSIVYPLRLTNSPNGGTGSGVGLQFYGWDAGIVAVLETVRAGNNYSPAYFAIKTFGGNNTDNTNTLAERLRIDGYGNIGIGTSNPGVSNLLELASTTKGFVIPRMTKVQRNAITTKVAGMMIYQTDNTPGLRVYNGSNWMKFTETTDN
ncbi:MAG: hypothetical protein HGB12_01730 [Bacteroidetes bacterium]|nr:hypothetical protein [Bacteroidota bacterium]